MSKIDKLSILGVRSFDNVRSETIQFHSPLTLIVGLNGSGKTTIIECLKFATTGILPPNTRNGGFVHDPKLCGEKEVLAQIKVGFRSTEGTRIVCTRSLQLTLKKNSQRSMKQLEGNLLIMRDGEKISMSSKVADLNTVMPGYLGVSKAVIDSVIFCHQEESLWPLSEPVKLKQRFDEIFEALKYTKAIDNIKVLQKGQKQALIGYKKDEEYLKAEKDRADKMERQSEVLHSEIEVLRTQVDEIGVRIREAAEKAEHAGEAAATANMIVGELTGKRIEARAKEESVHSLQQNLREMSDSDDDLQRMLEQYAERVQLYQDDLADFKSRWQALAGDINASRAMVGTKERECGSYEAQKESYDKQVQNREKLIKETARSHNIRGFDYEIGDDQVQAFMDRIIRMVKEQNATFERARQETQEQLSQAQKALNQINESKSALNQRKESSRLAITTNDRKIANLQRDLNKIDVDEGRMATLQSDLKERSATLDETKASVGTADWQSSIERDDTALRQLDEQKDRLDAELVESTRKASESARLDFVQKELKARQTSLETMMGAHTAKISSVVGQDWTHTSLEAVYERTLEQCSANVAEAERQRDGTTREKEQLDYQLITCKTQLKTRRAALTAAEQAVTAAIGVEPAEYTEEVLTLEQNRETLKADQDSFKVINAYFDQCVKDARSHSTCKTCTRKLKDGEIDVLVKNIDKMKERVTTDDKTMAELKEVEQALEAAKAVRAHFDDWERLKQKEIPALEREEKTLSAKAEQINAQLEEQDGVVSERQAARGDVESLGRTVQAIVKDTADISSFEAQIQELKAKAKAAGLSRSLDQIQQDIKKVNDESRLVKSRLTKASSDRDRSQALVNRLELEISQLQSKVSTAQYQLKEKKSYEDQIEEGRNANVEKREEVKLIDQELQSLGPQLSQAQIQYEDIARRGAEKDRELQVAVNKLNNSHNQLKLADQEISAYDARGGPQQLARGRREVAEAKEDVLRLERDQSGLTREIKGLEDQLRNHDDTKRGIEDNQRYRRDLRALERVRQEIAELESHNAEDDKARWERETLRWSLQRSKLSGEQASIIGSLTTKDAQLKRSMDDWETDFRDAGRKYKEAHIRAETTKACIEDLGRFGGALDKAILKFHSIKMEEINRIIGELWQRTYKGSDVDTILIRSESESGAKSYNYRVCMVKQDTEMDMRGRCSAGQKVLASIIIRLALAECFGVRCGLIALDEPTTNLDRENAEALAVSLGEIIKMRRSQPNFQLIVITHDEEFLRHMQCNDYADYYWRVGRNERQKSQIERQNISEVI